jgi:hypothetical protein
LPHPERRSRPESERLLHREPERLQHQDSRLRPERLFLLEKSYLLLRRLPRLPRLPQRLRQLPVILLLLPERSLADPLEPSQILENFVLRHLALPYKHRHAAEKRDSGGQWAVCRAW